MPDDPTTNPPTPNAGSLPTPARTFNQDEVNRIVQERVARLHEQYGGEPDAVRARVQRATELEQAQMTEVQRANQERDTAVQQATAAQQAALRMQVALERGFTGDRAWLATRLQGQTVEQLRADADAMLSLMSTPTAPPPEAPPAQPTIQPQPAPQAPPPGQPPTPPPVAVPPQDGGASPAPFVNEDEAVQNYMKVNYPFLFPQPATNGGQ